MAIGAAIAAERTRQGLRTSDLGIDRRIIEDIEAGRPGITTTQLEAVALALQVDPLALRAGKISVRQRPSVFLRHRGMQDFDEADVRLLDAALEHARSRNALARLVGKDLGIFPRTRLATREIVVATNNGPAIQGYGLARELRRVLGNEAGALGDLRELAESELGVVLVIRRLATIGSSAFSVKAGDAAAIVLAPKSHSREPHTRVSIAHELCHVLFDVDNGGVNIVVDFDVDRRAHQAEQRARAFAAELLVPEAGLQDLLGIPQEVTEEATAKNLVAMARDAFGSTWQVAANHLCNLHFVLPHLRPWLEQLEPISSTRDWTTKLPREAGPSLQVEQLAELAYDAGYLTDGDIRAILDLNPLASLPWER